MQVGGKTEDGVHPVSALRRELSEEIGLMLAAEDARHLGCYSGPAANEPGRTVKAEIFHVRTRHGPATQLEIEEAIWVDHVSGMALPPAPSTPRSHPAPISRSLISFLINDPFREDWKVDDSAFINPHRHRYRLNERPMSGSQ